MKKLFSYVTIKCLLCERNLLFPLLAIMMCLGFTAMSFGEIIVSVQPAQIQSPEAGEHLKIEIKITGGQDVAGYELTIGFDPSALRYVTGANADYLPAGAFAPTPIVSDNSIYIAATSLTGVAAAQSGTLATLTFEVVSVKSSAIRLMDVIISDSDAIELTVRTVDGAILAFQFLAWDVNQDNKVNILDLTLVARNLNTDPPENPRADVDGNGTVNILDLVLVANHLGESIEPAAHQIPTVTIEKLQSEQVVSSGRIGEKITWRLNANPAPKRDLVVNMGFSPGYYDHVFSYPARYDWIVIPQFKNHSAEFTTTTLFDREIQIHPLPMVSIVGKGLVVDLEELQKYLPDESREGHRIPKDFDFPLYIVGEPSRIVVEERFVDVAFVSANPENGGDLAANGSINVIFDNNPGSVTASTGTVVGSGKKRTILGPFTPGALSLTIEWHRGNGKKTLNYTVYVVDETPPKIVSSKPQNGEGNVDPDKVFEDGIVITFNEPVTGELMLMSGDDDVGWTDTYDGNKATLTGNASQKLRGETVYNVKGIVQDAAGNESEVSITFFTAYVHYYVAEENLVAYWSFEEGKGNIVEDVTGNGHNGKIMGSPRWVPGKFGGALEFDGENDYVTVSGDSLFNIEESTTLMAWFYLTDITTSHPLIMKNDSIYAGFNFIFKNLEFVRPYIVVASELLFPPFWYNIKGGEWVHLAATFKKDSIEMYIDGELVMGRFSKDVPIVTSSSVELWIGGDNSATRFSGIIDEIRLYNKALTEKEIKNIMMGEDLPK